jgi:hypothetical protein
MRYNEQSQPILDNPTGTTIRLFETTLQDVLWMMSVTSHIQDETWC